MSNDRTDPRAERDRNLGTLGRVTRGGPIAAAVGVLGFGALAAVTYSGSASGANGAAATGSPAATPAATAAPTDSTAAATAAPTATPTPTPTPAPTAATGGGGQVSTGSS